MNRIVTAELSLATRDDRIITPASSARAQRTVTFARQAPAGHPS
jgi:hypothetical protein